MRLSWGKTFSHIRMCFLRLFEWDSSAQFSFFFFSVWFWVFCVAKWSGCFISVSSAPPGFVYLSLCTTYIYNLISRTCLPHWRLAVGAVDVNGEATRRCLWRGNRCRVSGYWGSQTKLFEELSVALVLNLTCAKQLYSWKSGVKQ